ncbi:hypothetical protein FTO68_09765 [Methanocalculus taiwanensis]|uniref:DUF4352 domain-containing protein n=1 Tax=Methanocalculus taiwanensis TaxID=106207 RepID=A0ABD4TPQ2_9EURY|nr:hypothetical protein [Methanocalculus taiwanensis]MCQ1539265.1 hypothetical protein [Methanocalculus taiwanensis]
MSRMVIIAILSLLFLCASAGCTGILPGQNNAGTLPDQTQYQPTYEPAGETPAVVQPQAYAQTSSQSSGGVNSISRMVIWAEPMDMGAFHDLDGLIIKYCFYDTNNRPVSFDGTFISMQISIHTPDTNRQKLKINPRQIYRGSTTITRSLPDEEYPLRGIWIPYTELTLDAQDRGIGRVHVKATLPTGVVLEAEERYIWPVT